MTKTAPKTKRTPPTPPATAPARRALEPHEMVRSPIVQSAVGIQAWGKFAGTVDLALLVVDLHKRIEKVQSGDLQPVEAMLFGQAMTLETIFTNLARRAASQEYLAHFQAYLGMALRAQGQCRATLEALAAIKNPRPVAFVRQANISGGHQQVNNGPTEAGAVARAHGNDADAPNRLLSTGSHDDKGCITHECRVDHLAVGGASSSREREVRPVDRDVPRP